MYSTSELPKLRKRPLLCGAEIFAAFGMIYYPCITSRAEILTFTLGSVNLQAHRETQKTTLKRRNISA